jgi:signal transduction histidine kinase
VLLDLSLPDGKGVETLRDIRRLRPSLPVVVMSLHPEAEYGPAVRAAGAAAYLTKGAGAATIAAAVRRALGVTEDLPPDAPAPAPQDRADDERRRVARVLHDEVGQALVAAKIDLHLAATALDIEEARRRIAEAVRALDVAIGAVRDLTARVRPAGLDELSAGGTAP